MSQVDDAPVRSYVRKVRKRDDENAESNDQTEVKRKIAGDSGWTAEDKVPEPAEKITVEEGVDEFVTTLADDEDITQQVAQAPELVQPKVQTFEELNSQKQQLLPPNIDTKGFNLSMLISALYPLRLVSEKDIVWDHTQLLKELSTELQTNKDGLFDFDSVDAEDEIDEEEEKKPNRSMRLSQTTVQNPQPTLQGNLQFTQTMISQSKK